MWRAESSDGKVMAKRVWDNGGDVMVHAVFNGTHNGDLMGHAASGKAMGVETFDIYSFADGKITKWHHYGNLPALLSQIGAIPDMPAAPIPAMPTGEPEIVTGDGNNEAVESVRALYGKPIAEMAAACEAMTADDAVMHDLMAFKDQSKAESKAANEAFAKAMPDAKVTSQELSPIGAYVIAECEGTATWTGDLGPMKATGKPITMHWVDVTRWDGGKVKEGWSFMNGAEMMPPPAPAPPTAPPPAEGTVPAAPLKGSLIQIDKDG